jgi:hypothetical protein
MRKRFAPIWSVFNKIPDDQGCWNQLESYLQEHCGAEFNHGLCSNCAKDIHPQLKIDD